MHILFASGLMWYTCRLRQNERDPYTSVSAADACLPGCWLIMAYLACNQAAPKSLMIWRTLCTADARRFFSSRGSSGMWNKTKAHTSRTQSLESPAPAECVPNISMSWAPIGAAVLCSTLQLAIHACSHEGAARHASDSAMLSGQVPSSQRRHRFRSC